MWDAFHTSIRHGNALNSGGSYGEERGSRISNVNEICETDPKIKNIITKVGTRGKL